jgi:UDPglucose 6-dehydrogenase
MKISIIGTGYVGLVTGACLAEKGHEVICVDMNPERVAALNSAKSPIYEEGLDALLAKNVGKRLRATSDLASAVLATDATFIAVGTPFDGKTIDLTAVLGATREIGEALEKK